MITDKWMTDPAPSWMENDGGPLISLTAVLARNVKDLPFPEKGDGKSRRKARALAEKAVRHWNEDHAPFTEYTLAGLSENEKELLSAKGLLPEFKGIPEEESVVFTDRSGRFSIAVNGTDDLEMRCMTASDKAENLWDELSYLDSMLERDMDYAFDEEFGYLTASPYKAGTALTMSALLFLPGLSRSGMLRKAAANAARLGFALTKAYGDGRKDSPYCRLTNTVTLGVTERMIASRMKQLIGQLREAEERTWKTLFREKENVIKDQIWRALGTLKYARRMDSAETAACAGLMKLGIAEDMFPAKDPLFFEKLLMLAEPSLVKAMTGKEELDEEGIRLWRAVLLRQAVQNAGF